MSLTEAAEQALEALEIGYNIEHTLPGNKSCSCSQCKFVRLRTPAITSLRTALAEDAMQRLTDTQQEMESAVKDQVTYGMSITLGGKRIDPASIYKQEPEPEPVAWLIESYDIYAKRTLQRLVFDNPKNMQGVKITAYYTAPPKRKPLTDEEMRGCAQAMDAEPLAEGWTELIKFARAIERAHVIGDEE